MNTSKKLVLITVFLTTLSALMAPSGLSQYDSNVYLTSIEQVKEGDQVNIEVTLINKGSTHKVGVLSIGSESTGEKSREILLEPWKEKTFQIGGFPIDKEETFEVKLSNQGVNLIQPRYITVGPSNSVPGDGGIVDFVLNNLLILIGVAIITVIGVILLTPFIYHPKGTKPFEAEIEFDEVKDKR